ncbi:uncharacterized protein LOC62_06G008189 [Vanrija pseudolonga]|uniref:Meiotically up-regulated gene 80 protein n=1 Tax=Vanrija pseudolonga TaxID=143232 RepID=A0AAF1BL46_9TREE|nr:Meiotically up-regulated gene 80 protein [Vanrija pseudolonga]
MTWASTSYQAAAGSTSSFEPQTPPLSGCATGPIMDGYANAWDVNGNADYDPSYDMPPMLEDPLMVKGAANEAAPLHTYMAPLSLNAAPSLPSPPPSKRIDMRLAQPGSEESKPGYLTPLASYTAETFWYFWYAVISPIDMAGRRVSNFHSTTTAEPFDSEGRPRHAIDPGQLQPNVAFRQFVFSVLHSTQVSFSVTILALMYTYKYKKIMALGQRLPYKHEVSEAQGFVTGLMLANKYLDDNTYTNTTWAQFLGIPVKDVNEYELDWLDALKFNLYVGPDDFENWRSMLDAHVRSRERGDALAAMSVADPFSPGVRARSASPPLGYFDHANGQDASLRKRSAKDAFAADVLHNTGMYEAARLGARKASFAPLPGYPTASTALPTPTPSVLSPTNVGGHASGSSLGRSSSLSRQIARLPNGRRDSSGQDQIATATMDLRHAAAANTLSNWVYPTPAATEALQFDKDDRWRQAAARQHRLYFLQAAATPQFGPDPRYHKAIPHYVDPSTGYGYTAAAVAAAQYGTQEIMDVDHLANEINLASPTDVAMAQQQQQQQMLMAMQQQAQPAVPSAYIPIAQPVLHPHFHNPQPAQFANAGPPGYAYGAPAWFQPQQQPQPQPLQLQQPQPWVATRHWRAGHASRWSTSSEEGYMNLRPPPICNSVSEWSSPLHAGY